MNTLFSQPIHHTAGNIVLQHLVFRLFLCSKHCWYKPFVLHPTMHAKPHYCSIILGGLCTHLKYCCYRTNYELFEICILFRSLKSHSVSLVIFIISTRMLDKKTTTKSKGQIQSYRIWSLKMSFYEIFSEPFEQNGILDISGFSSIYQQTQTAFGLREQHQK